MAFCLHKYLITGYQFSSNKIANSKIFTDREKSELLF